MEPSGRSLPDPPDAGQADPWYGAVFGGLGGSSDVSPLVFRAAVKQTPYIAKVHSTAGKDGKDFDLSIGGRHDPMIVPRAVVVVESMAAVTIADGLLMNLSASMDSVKKIYG